MRTLTKKYLGGTDIKEDRYKVDLAVLERYQSFSAEILRLALLGIAGYGFLISNVIFRADVKGNYSFYSSLVDNKNILVIGVAALAISAATALAHRFYSTDCLTHFVRRLRLSQTTEARPDHPNIDRLQKIIENEEISLEKDLRVCHWVLVLSTLSLAIGAICVALAFAVALSPTPVPK